MALTGMLAVIGILGAGQASAAFTTGGYCGTPGATGGISVSNMTLNGNDATDCYGLVDIGGNVADEIGNINALGWGTYSATNYLKDDTGGSSTADFLGLRWTLAANNGSNNSTYTLTVEDLDLVAAPSVPFTVDLIGFLKAGQPGAFYFFDNADRPVERWNVPDRLDGRKREEPQQPGAVGNVVLRWRDPRRDPGPRTRLTGSAGYRPTRHCRARAASPAVGLKR